MNRSNPKELLKFRADPVLRRAIKLRAALEDVDLQDVIVAALRAYLVDEIAEVERRGLISGPKSQDKSDQPGKKLGGGGGK